MFPWINLTFCADEESTWLHFANILPRWTRWKKMSYNSFVPGSKATIQSCAAGWRRDYIEASKSCTPALFSFNFNYILWDISRIINSISFSINRIKYGHVYTIICSRNSQLLTSIAVCIAELAIILINVGPQPSLGKDLKIYLNYNTETYLKKWNTMNKTFKITIFVTLSISRNFLRNRKLLSILASPNTIHKASCLLNYHAGLLRRLNVMYKVYLFYFLCPHTNIFHFLFLVFRYLVFIPLVSNLGWTSVELF